MLPVCIGGVVTAITASKPHYMKKGFQFMKFDKLAIARAATVTLALSGCSDPKEASKSNFESAIDAWISKNPPCLSVPHGSIEPREATDRPFPRYLDSSPVTASFALENRERQRAPFDALVDAGLLKVEETTIEAKAGLFADTVQKVPVRAYDLTDAGTRAISTKRETTAFSSPSQHFCYGTPKVDEIDQFTEPGDAMGMKVSQVSYRYHIADLPAWAKNTLMQAAFPQLAKDTAESLKGKAAVVLTNEGWVHERATKL